MHITVLRLIVWVAYFRICIIIIIFCIDFVDIVVSSNKLSNPRNLNI